jgi:hypothetical protein
MEQPNKVEMGIAKWLLARIKSKSPTLYANISKIAAVVIAITGGFVAAYNLGLPHSSYDHMLGVIDNICVVIGAAATSLFGVAVTTTTDPTLIERKTPSDTSNRGNDTN